MRIRLPDEEARQLAALVEAARLRTEKKGLSASAWLGGAVRVAAADDEVADRIAEAAPETGRGGERPGAGRPRKEKGAGA